MTHTINSSLPPIAHSTDATQDASDDLILGLQTAIDQTGSYIFMKDREGRYTYVNQMVQQLFATTYENIIGKDDSHFFKIEEVNDFRLNDRRVLDQGETIAKEEITVIKSTGESRIYWAVKKPVMNAQGKIVGMCGISTDITELKNAHHQLQVSSEELKESQLIAGLGSYVLDIASGVWKSSFALDQIFGIDANYSHDVAGWKALIYPDDREMMLSYFLDEVLARGKIFDKEYRIIRQHDQAVRWVHGMGKLDFDPNGRPLKMHGTIQDITSRKLDADEVRSSRAKLQAALSSMSDAVFISDTAGNFIDFNEAFATFHKFNNKLECAKTLSEYPNLLDVFTIDGEPLALEQWAVSRALRGESATNAEFILQRRDTGEKWTGSYTFAPIREQSGEIVGAVVTARDITERKQIENLLVEREKDFRQLAEAMPQIVWVTRADGWNIYFNQQWVTYTGLSLEESTGEGWSKPFHPDDQLRAWEAWRKAVNNKVNYSIECRIRKANGEYLWWLIRGVPILGKKGEIDKWFGTCTDINDIKIAEQRLLIAATVFESQEGMMVTDCNNLILNVNSAFCRITGYSAEEVIGKNPRLLGSGRQDADFYTYMWGSLKRFNFWEGEIWNKRKNGEIYPEHLTVTAVKDSLGKVTNYVATLTDITLSRDAAKEIQHLAYYDTLTRLPNRRLCFDHLKQAVTSSQRSGKKGAVLFLDLDNFKTINDTLGHEIGDVLLQQAAKRLASSVRDGDTVARMGGDEFVVILTGLSEESVEAAAQTEALGSKILAELNHPYLFGVHQHRCSTSIGVAMFANNQIGIDELFKRADIAMYQAKKAGRNTLRFFDPQMQANINARVALETELSGAIDKQQLQLHYQVQVDNLRQTLGAEALIRWFHPVRGMVSPAQFITLAEETGLIISIGQWVLETACAQLKIWQQRPATQQLTLSINVSARQFHEAQFVAQVHAAVLRHGINPALLKLEPTESILLENIEDAVATMNALKSIGVHFALDDFGTGFSSLQYLKKLPLNQLKIDQSFVRDLTTDSNDKAIVRTIIAMAQSLNLKVIAEGVETEQQHQLLLKKGCDQFQGYLYGRPVSIEEFEAHHINLF